MISKFPTRLLVMQPTLSRFIAVLPWLNQVGSSEDGTKENAETAHDNVRNAEEWISPAHHGSSGDQDGLFATVDLYWEA